MLSYDKANRYFEEYLKEYDVNNSKISHKIVHAYGVVDSMEYICNDLGLNKENTELAKIIALLHDIGRFEQARVYDNYIDYKTTDHGDLGVKILFEDNLIRKFVEEDKYDNIIFKAIKNHNKYKLEDTFTEEELFHTKLIRDADKTDSFRVKSIDDVKDMSGIDVNIMVTEQITDKIFNEFMNHNTILTSDRKTYPDMWISYIAFIFDFNFASGLKYLKEKNYINILVDRFSFVNPDTKDKLEQIRKCAIDYIDADLKK